MSTTTPAGVRARCVGCGRGLGFEEWSRGLDRCPYCSKVPNRARAGARREPPPQTRGRVEAPPARRAAAAPAPGPVDDYGALLDEIPEDLLDELVEMLESEVASRPALAQKLVKPAPATAVAEVIDEIGIGHSVREWWWAAWGFAGGFAINIFVAKYAQMTTGTTMADMLAPLLIGGVVAGSACAVIGWGLAKLVE